MRILCFDPSGNFTEGKGTTGWAIFEDGELKDFGEIKSSDFAFQEEYWADHERLIFAISPDLILCESYHLFGQKAKAQTGSAMETSQLIGYMKMVAWKCDIVWVFQHPDQKTPVNDERLVRAGVFMKKGNKHYCMDRPTNLHMRDAIRHGVYYYKLGKGKVRGSG